MCQLHFADAIITTSLTRIWMLPPFFVVDWDSRHYLVLHTFVIVFFTLPFARRCTVTTFHALIVVILTVIRMLVGERWRYRYVARRYAGYCERVCSDCMYLHGESTSKFWNITVD